MAVAEKIILSFNPFEFQTYSLSRLFKVSPDFLRFINLSSELKEELNQAKEFIMKSSIYNKELRDKAFEAGIDRTCMDLAWISLSPDLEGASRAFARISTRIQEESSLTIIALKLLFEREDFDNNAAYDFYSKKKRGLRGDIG